jgi:fatty-acyl-CoA synthase
MHNGVCTPIAPEALERLRVIGQVSPDELIMLVRERKGPIAAPKAVEFIDAIPLTPVGKADKRALRTRYWGDEQRSVH